MHSLDKSIRLIPRTGLSLAWWLRNPAQKLEKAFLLISLRILTTDASLNAEGILSPSILVVSKIQDIVT